MTYFGDLDRCTYCGPTRGSVLAIGWLDRSHEPAPATTSVSRSEFRKLVEMLVDPWQPAVAAGRHPCELCDFTGGPATLLFEDTTVAIGSTNLFVPSDEALFVAPSLIAHYIDAHRYVPPLRFLAALAGCPPMRSVPYLHAIKRHL